MVVELKNIERRRERGAEELQVVRDGQGARSTPGKEKESETTHQLWPSLLNPPSVLMPFHNIYLHAFLPRPFTTSPFSLLSTVSPAPT